MYLNIFEFLAQQVTTWYFSEIFLFYKQCPEPILWANWPLTIVFVIGATDEKVALQYRREQSGRYAVDKPGFEVSSCNLNHNLIQLWSSIQLTAFSLIVGPLHFKEQPCTVLLVGENERPWFCSWYSVLPMLIQHAARYLSGGVNPCPSMDQRRETKQISGCQYNAFVSSVDIIETNMWPRGCRWDYYIFY